VAVAKTQKFLIADSKFYLGHGLGNIYWVADQFAFPFVSWIRMGFSAIFQKSDWLIVGQCDTAFASLPARLGSQTIGSQVLEKGSYDLAGIDEGYSADIVQEVPEI
jgi:hypothetical protein